ncbi:MAG: thymidine phosphorylase [Acidobacteriota bacterium]
MLHTVEIIRKKRDGRELSAAEISYFIKGYLNREVADYQMSALLMAIYLRGLNEVETQAFTEEMLYSGEVLDFSYLPQAKIDKHSTGGVGDKTSLVLAPLAAAAGLYVPMISGRGLGHTGGTLDKLESIPGFNAQLSLSDFRKVIEKVGAAIIGQTEEIAPADRRIYALRDVTATVESIPLITASIMSKKLAEGIDCLVLDVKCGNGAFMETAERALALAQSLVKVGKRMHKRITVLITDMNQPLGWAVGNSLEVIESIDTLKGKPGIFTDLCVELAAAMLHTGGIVTDIDAGKRGAERLIENGSALEKFCEMVTAQGGNAKIIDDYSLLPQASYQKEVLVAQDGYISSIDTHGIGMAAMILGAGRQRLDSQIDYGVGIKINVKLGDYVNKGDLLCTIYYNNAQLLAETEQRLLQAYQISAQQPPLLPLVKGSIH